MNLDEFIRVLDRNSRRRDGLRLYRAGLGHDHELEQRVWDLFAASEVERYQHYVELLVSLHRQCAGAVDWHAVAAAPPSSQPNGPAELARRVLAVDPDAYGPALDAAGAFDDLAAFGWKVSVSAAEPDGLALACVSPVDSIPEEELKSEASGRPVRKALSAGRAWSLCQDHLCSAAVRVAREVFAVLPISRTIVNVARDQVSSKTGHPESVTVLAVQIVRASLAAINLDRIDPSDSMSNFPHRMKFKKSAGPAPVEPMSLDEQWVTS